MAMYKYWRTQGSAPITAILMGGLLWTVARYAFIPALRNSQRITPRAISPTRPLSPS